jgi:hypothetical protein
MSRDTEMVGGGRRRDRKSDLGIIFTEVKVKPRKKQI